MSLKPIKVCLTCCHLEMTGEGESVPGLRDSAYAEFHCRKYDLTTREHPLFPSGEGGVVEIRDEEKRECEGWEAWVAE